MKKIICLFLAALLLGSFSGASAGVSAFSGDGESTVTFCIFSDGDGYLLLEQSEGKCREKSWTHPIDGPAGTEPEWGKYHLYISSPDGRCYAEDWDKTFYGGSFDLYLPEKGTYEITVRPFTADEMTASWDLDVFECWTVPPRWWIAETRNCYFAADRPGGGASGNTEPGVGQSGRTGGSQTGRTDGNPSAGVYDMGVPKLGGQTFGQNEMNVYIYWVQVQMKATGRWYQGSSWDETGNLGDHTMSEIAGFMRSRGYRNHSGRVGQDVVDELAACLGSGRRPVYLGGYYDALNTLLGGGAKGSMSRIDASSPAQKIRWVQTCLSALGYYGGSVDGRFGSGTAGAVNRFQSDHGFEQRDYVTYGVARAMLEAYYSRTGSAAGLP